MLASDAVEASWWLRQGAPVRGERRHRTAAHHLPHPDPLERRAAYHHGGAHAEDACTGV